MRTVYGARTTTADDPAAWTVPALVPGLARKEEA
jgi:hypothetical protein